MGKQFNQYMVVRIIDPTIGNAVKITQCVSRMSPKAPLQSIGGRVPVAHFAYVIVFAVIKPIHRMFSASFHCFP